jgi:sialic acid synthase SpsE
METKIIAELCYNHCGSFNLAIEMIEECAKLKLWGVKLQKWDIDSFPDEIKQQKRTDKHSFGSTYYEHRKKLEFNIEQLLELKRYVEKKELIFICSAKDLNSLKLLIENGINNIKLPSQRLLDKHMLEYIKHNRNMIRILMLSTGMHYEEEIINAEILKYADVIMHCITDYPAKLNDCDVGYMRNIGLYNGYSSHEFEGRAIKYAVAAGAKYIERHYTLDKTMKGADHIVSSDYNEMKRIIEDIKEAEMIMGNGKREMNKPELKNREYYLKF